MAFSDHVKMLFGADTSGVTSELSKTEKKAKAFKDKVGPMLKGALGTVAFTKATQAVIEYGTSIGDMSDRLGTTTGFMQSLTYAAEQNGIKADSAKIAYQRFTRRLEEANTKGGPLKKTLDDIGISTKKLDGTTKDTETVFKEFAETLKGMDNPAQKVRTAFQFLDTEGVAFTQMLQQGKPTIEEYGKEAEKLGLILDDKLIKELQDADAKLKKLKTGFIVALAQGITPFLTALAPLAGALKNLVTESGKWAKEITALVVTIGTLKTALVVGNWLTAGALAFKGLASAIGLANTKMIKLNATMKKNVFVLVTSLIVAGGVALFEWANKAEKATNKAKELEEELKQKLKVAIADLKVLLGQASVETDKLVDEFNKLNKTKVKIDFDKVLEDLKDMNTELQHSITNLTNIVLENKENLKSLEAQKKELERIGGKETEILKLNKKIVEAQLDIERSEADLYREKIKQVSVNNEIKETIKKQKDEYYAQELKLQDVLGEMDKQELTLKRQLELTKTLKEEGKEAYDKVVERHAMEDKVADLVKSQGMSVRDAWNTVVSINSNKRIQRRLLDDIKKKEGEAKAEAEKRLAENERITAELRKQVLAHAQARQEADLILQALKARVAGNDDLAKKLEAQKDLQDKIKQAMDQQGLALGQAQAQIKARLDLEKELELKKIEEEKQEKIIAKVRELAQKNVRDAIDKEEKKRIQMAQTIEAIDKKILALKGEQNDQAKDAVKEWEKVKYRNLKLLLDDETQADLDALAKQKVIIQDNHAVQLQALKDAGQVVQDQALANQQAVAQAGIDIAQQGQAQQAKVQGVMDAGKDAIENVGDATVKKLDAIQKDPAVKDAVADAELGIVQAIKNCCTQIVQAIKSIKISSGSGTGSGSTPAPATPPAPSAPINNTINVSIDLSGVKSAIKEMATKVANAIKSAIPNSGGTPPPAPTPPPVPPAPINNTIDVTIDLSGVKSAISEMATKVANAIKSAMPRSGGTPPPAPIPPPAPPAPINNVINVTIDLTGVKNAIKQLGQTLSTAIASLKGGGKGNPPPPPPVPPPPPAPINNVINVTISLDAVKQAIQQLGQTLSSAIASLKGGGSGNPPTPPPAPPAPAPAVNNTINVTIDLTKLEQKLDQLVQQVVAALGQLGGGNGNVPPASPSSGASAPVVNVTVNMVSELKEQTQQDILTAVRGKFKYQ